MATRPCFQFPYTQNVRMSLQPSFAFALFSPSMEARLSASVLGILATGYDMYSTRRRELEYVWKGPFQLTFVRCLFILARYLAILIHIANIILSSIATARFSGTVRAPPEFCKSSQIFELVSCYSMFLVLHLILMLRVWALYDQSLNLGLFLLTLLIGRNAGLTLSAWAALKRPGYVEFGEDCFPKLSLLGHPLENPIAFLIYGELITQFILHGLAWKRTLWDLRDTKLPSQPALLSVLNRDSLKVFMGISVAMTAIAIAVTTRGKPGLFIFPLFISFLSAASTRTILNLQTLHAADDAEAASSRPKALELTEINDFATWDASTFLESEHEPSQNMRSRVTAERL